MYGPVADRSVEMVTPDARHAKVWRLVPVAAMLMFALVLRSPIAVIPPLLAEIQADLGIDAATAGLLTSIPVFCFGLLTPVASRVLGAIGINLSAVYCVVGVVIGSAVRSADGPVAAFAGTAFIGISLAIGNLAVPMLIGRQFRHRAELLTGAYVVFTNLSVTAVTALAVPTSALMGWRWTSAGSGVFLGAMCLAFWVLVYPPGVSGARAWIRQRAGHPDPVEAAARTGAGRVVRGPLWKVTGLLSIAFAGQTFTYYAITAWLPTALVDLQGMTIAEAGLAASLFQACGMLGPLLVPVMKSLGLSSAQIVGAMGGAWVVMASGLLFAPSLWAVWSVFGGIASGGFFTAVMSVVIRRSRSIDENRQTTAMMQTVGYCVAAIGPVLTGWVHQRVAGWSVPFAIILGVTVVMLVSSILAIRTPRERAAR
jgi:CP family cyanate transporter-like MFS transporter